MLLTTVTTSVPAQAERDADWSEYGSLSLKTRAEFGRAACEVGDPDHGVSDPETTVVDTIANVLHYFEQQRAVGEQFDPETITDAAIRHFEAEVSEA